MKFKKNFFTEQLRNIMFEKKLTQEDLGKKLGVNRQMISRWLNMDRNPSLTSIKKIANALNVSINYFIKETEVESELNRENKKNNMDEIKELIKENIKPLEKKIKKIEKDNAELKLEIQELKEKM